LIGQGEAASVAQHVGMDEQGQGSGGAVFSQEQVNGRACNGLRCSLAKERLAGRFHPGTFFHALALSSSPRRSCVVDNPPFNRATCSTRLSVSTWSSFIRQASDTRKPCRNIRSNKQRSRARSCCPWSIQSTVQTSQLVRCFRSLPPANVPRFASVHHFVESLSCGMPRKPA